MISTKFLVLQDHLDQHNSKSSHSSKEWSLNPFVTSSATTLTQPSLLPFQMSFLIHYCLTRHVVQYLTPKIQVVRTNLLVVSWLLFRVLLQSCGSSEETRTCSVAISLLWSHQACQAQTPFLHGRNREGIMKSSGVLFLTETEDPESTLRSFLP